MSLSDKIVDEKKMFEEHDYKVTCEDFLWTDDVKEAIKELKEAIIEGGLGHYVDCEEDVIKAINKIFGDKLI